MVRIPFVYVKAEPETGMIKMSREPTNAGYIEESLWGQAVANGSLPPDVTKFTDENNKIVGYVRFGPYTLTSSFGDLASVLPFDLSNFQQDDLYISILQIAPGGNKQQVVYVYIKAQIEPDIVFLDRSIAFSPRAVITLPAPLLFKDDFFDEHGDISGMLAVIASAAANQVSISTTIWVPNPCGIPPTIPTTVTNKLSEVIGWNPTTDAQNGGLMSSLQSLAQDLINKLSLDSIRHTLPSYALIPQFAVVPLKSNIETYGPWYSIGAQGQVEFEQDTTLVPWAYNGFTLLNQVANSSSTSFNWLYIHALQGNRSGMGQNLNWLGLGDLLKLGIESQKTAWIVDNQVRDSAIAPSEVRRGTLVELVVIPGHVPRPEEVFAAFTDPVTLRLTRTRATIKLAGLGQTLVSCSEAKRLVARLTDFRHAHLDFSGVEVAGQGFCDEVFRVFARAHPDVTLEPVGMNDAVAFMVNRARATARP